MMKHNKANGSAPLRRMAAKSLLACGLLLCSVWAQAQNAIQSITGGLQGGVEILRIETAEPLTAVPTGFTVQAPARIALDFLGVVNNVGRSTVEINQGNLRSANVVQAGERTRVVINLKQAASYQARTEGKFLIVVLDRSVGTAPAEAAPAAFAESRNRDMSALRDIDFRKGTGSAGRVVVDLANNQVGVDIRQQGQTLVVEFLKTSLPEGLRRRLDVTDFGTPVQTIETNQNGDRVRMVVTPKGNWEHSAYQSDNQFVLEVRERVVDNTKLTQGIGYTGEKLSLNFQNIEVRSLLQVIADFTSFNVVTSDSVSGAVTLRLKDVPWDQALDIILQAKGLDKRKNGNVLWIAPKDEIAAREKQTLESQASTESLEPVRTQGFQMNYAKAADIALQIGGTANTGTGTGGANARILSMRGSVISEPRTNQLFVTDIPSRLEQVQSLIAKLDIPIRQVLIEARIVEADDRFGKSLGVRLGGGNIGVGGGSNRVGFGSTYSATSPGVGNGSYLSMPASGLGGIEPATLAISLFNAFKTSQFLNLEISALEADGRGKIVSSPRIVTSDQVKAVIEQGNEFPYQKATSSGATSVEFKKATLKLEVTPQITPEGSIILDVDVAKDSRGERTDQGIAINTKRVQTQVLVENGGTVVIGGIFELLESEDSTKVPVLGDIPYVGNLFKNKNRTINRSELLIFITPRVISDRGVNR